MRPATEALTWAADPSFSARTGGFSTVFKSRVHPGPELVPSLGVKVFRRTPPLDPAARARALARLTPRLPHHPHPTAPHLHTPYADQTPADRTTTEQTPTGQTTAVEPTLGGWTPAEPTSTGQTPAEQTPYRQTPAAQTAAVGPIAGGWIPAERTSPARTLAGHTPAGEEVAAERSGGGQTSAERTAHIGGPGGAPATADRGVHPSGRQPSDKQRRDEYPEERDEVRGGWTPEQPRPDRLRDARWTLTPRHIAVLAVVLILGLTWAAWTFLRARPEPLPDTRPTTAITGSAVAQPTPTQPGPASTQTQPAANQTPGASSTSGANQTPGTNQTPGNGTSSGQPPVVVHVAGKVRRPGLIRAPAGSRVADVLTLAGGPLRGVDLTTLNLARQVTDGEQIIVGTTTQSPQTNQTPPTSGPSPSSAPNAPVNLNTATLDQLDALPGVGPVLAQRILDYRTQNGPFTTIDQLQEVPGVGPKKFDSLKPHVRT
ncbi:helix-hairpin-helix domain-containing protein [Kribbella sp. C-35]|uniref:helix-hairpin-helix domain-containing protein n=1 Tax=Kribbella sp. C-35 TaxID=2789276 RepID=UPI003978DBB1